MTIAGLTFTVSQSGAACSYALSSSSAAYPSSGGAGSVSVTASASDCAWIATSNAAWITVTSGTPGIGNGSVGYSVAANSSSSPRAGTMTIAGLTFTVSQSGTSACTYSLPSTSASYSSGGGTGSVSVNTSSGCSWTATSNGAWITITSGSSGSGNGSVGYSVAANSGLSPRVGTMTIAENTFTVSQAGANNDTLRLSAGWNLVSVPRVPSNYSAGVLFPNKLGSMYAYNPALRDYQAAPILANGPGYWLNNSRTDTIVFIGSVPGSLIDTAAQAGWVLIGSRDTTFHVSLLILSDGATRMGSAYRYDAVARIYQATAVIDPGEAVWINVNKACTVTFP